MFYPKTEPEPMVACDQTRDLVESISARTIGRETLQSLIAAQEKELSNIARELHDDICQRLAMLSLKIEKVARSWAGGQVQIGEQLEEIWRQCSVLTGDVQALSHELHPSLLDNLGLVAAVKSFCREVSEQNGAVVEFADRDVPASLPRDVSVCLFRLIQEAVHNSLKYSGTNHFHIHLQGEQGELELEVRDYGVGFDVASAQRKGGLGLVSMRERIHLLGGKITIESRPNIGTKIRASVPVAVPRHAMSAFPS